MKEDNSTKKELPKVDMKEVYGEDEDYVNHELKGLLKMKPSPEMDITSDQYMIVHPPLIDKIDKRLHPIFSYDGYGTDIRPRISGMKKFNEKTKNPDLLE